MKKILFLLLVTISSYGQVNNSDYIQKTLITGTIEIDGHESKNVFILETNLEGIKIYDRDSKQEYKLRKCKKDKCKIIHLELKNNLMFNSGNIIFTPNYYATPTNN